MSHSKPAPREELEWLAAYGSPRHLGAEDVISMKGVLVQGMFVLLIDHVAIFVDRGAGRHKVLEWRAGDVAGCFYHPARPDRTLRFGPPRLELP